MVPVLKVDEGTEEIGSYHFVCRVSDSKSWARGFHFFPRSFSVFLFIFSFSLLL
jgi:hypothetical protein